MDSIVFILPANRHTSSRISAHLLRDENSDIHFRTHGDEFEATPPKSSLATTSTVTKLTPVPAPPVTASSPPSPPSASYAQMVAQMDPEQLRLFQEEAINKFHNAREILAIIAEIDALRLRIVQGLAIEKYMRARKALKELK